MSPRIIEAVIATSSVLNVVDQKRVRRNPIRLSPIRQRYTIMASDPSPRPPTIMECEILAPTGPAGFSTATLLSTIVETVIVVATLASALPDLANPMTATVIYTAASIRATPTTAKRRLSVKNRTMPHWRSGFRWRRSRLSLRVLPVGLPESGRRPRVSSSGLRRWRG